MTKCHRSVITPEDIQTLDPGPVHSFVDFDRNEVTFLQIAHEEGYIPLSEVEGDFRVVSFNRNHVNFVPTLEEAMEWKRRAQTEPNVFLLSAYIHGAIVWSLKGEGTRCQWDSVATAGALQVPEDCTDYEAAARAFLSEYNAWANGDVYFASAHRFTLRTGPKGAYDLLSDYRQDEAKLDESCGFFFGVDAAREWLEHDSGVTP